MLEKKTTDRYWKLNVNENADFVRSQIAEDFRVHLFFHNSSHKFINLRVSVLWCPFMFINEVAGYRYTDTGSLRVSFVQAIFVCIHLYSPNLSFAIIPIVLLSILPAVLIGTLSRIRK